MFARKWSRRTISVAVCCAILAVVLAVGLARSRAVAAPAQVPFSDLLRHLDRSDLSEVVVAGDLLEFKLATGESFRTVAPSNYVTANSAFVSDLSKKNVRIDVRTTGEPLGHFDQHA